MLRDPPVFPILMSKRVALLLFTDSRRKVTGRLSSWQTLVDAILDEDRILRRRLAGVQPPLTDRRGPDGTLSLKETLAHIAFWDGFTVRFFEDKLQGRDPAPPEDFTRQSEEAIYEAADLALEEVLTRYLEATGALVDFLGRHWDDLSEKEQKDFWVPLKHRRHHRVILFRALDAMTGPDTASELAAGA